MPLPRPAPMLTVILTRRPRQGGWLSSNRMTTTTPTREHPGKLEEHIRRECLDCPDFPDWSVRQTSRVRRMRIRSPSLGSSSSWPCRKGRSSSVSMHLGRHSRGIQLLPNRRAHHMAATRNTTGKNSHRLSRKDIKSKIRTEAQAKRRRIGAVRPSARPTVRTVAYLHNTGILGLIALLTSQYSTGGLNGLVACLLGGYFRLVYVSFFISSLFLWIFDLYDGSVDRPRPFTV